MGAFFVELVKKLYLWESSSEAGERSLSVTNTNPPFLIICEIYVIIISDNVTFKLRLRYYY